MNRSIVSFLTFWATSVLLAWSASAVTIPTVPVGNPGNPNDPSNGNIYGGVPYAYRIGTYEVTIGQYAEFLNAVARTDTYQLYHLAMAQDLNVAGIARDGFVGSYSYRVFGSPNKPVSNVGWGDTLRFTNWLHNGQPVGSQNASTTEDGAYTLNGALSNTSLNSVIRNATAKWFLPTQNEWYKAAFYQPASAGGDFDDYWRYPTRTNSDPYSDQPPGNDSPARSNTANFRMDDRIANGYNDGFAVTGSNERSMVENYLTNVGAYTESVGPFGTFDQGGNVEEWTETVFDSLFHIIENGSWDSPAGNLSSLSSGGYSPFNSERPTVGFRVATVPEPSTLTLAALGALALLFAARRKR